jgi:hypothetical protein
VRNFERASLGLRIRPSTFGTILRPAS